MIRVETLVATAPGEWTFRESLPTYVSPYMKHVFHTVIQTL